MAKYGHVKEVLRETTLKPIGSWKQIYIYALTDPRTDEIRYIGKSERPYERVQNHMKSRERCHRTNWLNELKRQGLVPGFIVLETICGNWPWQYSERFWIAYGKAQGWPLTNNTSGGDGVPGLPPETREKMRQVWLGRKHKPESLVKIGAASRGRKFSAEVRARMSAAHKGRKITWGAKLGEANRKFTPEQQAEIVRRIADGEMVKDLAREYGTHRTTISKIKGGTYR